MIISFKELHDHERSAETENFDMNQLVNKLLKQLETKDRQMEQRGVNLNRVTIANWFNICVKEYLEPVYNRLHKHLLEQSVLHADEIA